MKRHAKQEGESHATSARAPESTFRERDTKREGGSHATSARDAKFHITVAFGIHQNRNDFTALRDLPYPIWISTPNNSIELQANQVGTIFLTHVNIHDEVITTRLSDVLYVPGMSKDSKLISMGMLLKAGLHVFGDEETLTFINKFDDKVLEFQQNDDKEALFWLKATTTKPKHLTSMRTISKESYGLMHRRFAHASKEAIRRAQKTSVKWV